MMHAYRSPIGEMVFVLREGALVRLEFVEGEGALEMGERGGGEAGDGDPSEVRAALDAYFAGELGALAALRAGAVGTPFQRRVWEALRAIEPATTTSYGALAHAMGRPGAARAVGAANARNPVAIVVPCHRVIGGSGALVGYAGGLGRKQWLLAHERQYVGKVSAFGGAGSAV